MSKQLILAHDLGTSGNKACLFDIDGKYIGSCYKTYETYFDKVGYAEQNPDDWWKAVKESTLEVIKTTGVDPKDIKAMSFSAHSLGCVPVDKDGKLTRSRAMIWMDGRAVKESEYILSKYGERRHYETTGNSFAVSLYPVSKIRWLKANEPEVDKNTFKYIGTKEYIISKFTGKFGFTDYSEAGMSGAFNLRTHNYEQEILDIAGVDRNKLCDPIDNTFVVGNVLPSLEKETGLTSETKVVLGTLDNLACATGAGCMNKGTFVVCLGTAAWIGVNSDRPLMSPDFKANVMYVGNGMYHTSMHSHSACVVNDWIVDKMLHEYKGDFKKLEEIAREIPAGSEKLLFQPSFSSGNTIYSSDYLGGTFLGMRLHHSQGHLMRAALEGVGFDLMMGSEFFKSLGVPPEKATIIGGGSKNKLWREIISSMLDARLGSPNNMQHIGAIGAMAIAGIGAGLFKDFSVVDKIIASDVVTEPSAQDHETYKNILPVYKLAYESVMPVYKELYKEK